MRRKTKVLPTWSGTIDCALTTFGAQTTIFGQYPVEVVRDATSFYVEGYQFAKPHREGHWDGRKRLFSSRQHTFPSGLLPGVIAALRRVQEDAKIRIADVREEVPPPAGANGFELLGVAFGEGKYDYQLEAAQAMVRGKRGILKIATNGGKTEIACAVTRHLALPTVFIVPSRDLMYQSQARFAKRLGIPLDEVGLLGDGIQKIGRWITVASVHTLSARVNDAEIIEARKRWQIFFADECHRVASDVFYDVLDGLDCYYRFGLSGTPLDRSDGADLMLVAQTGEILYEVRNKLLVERGISVQPHIEIVRVDKPQLPSYGLSWSSVYKAGVTKNDILNQQVADKAASYLRQGLQILVCVDQIAHGQTLNKLVGAAVPGVVHQFVNGAEDTDVRQRALREFEAGDVRCLIATAILDQGIDVSAIDVIIFADSNESKIRTLQRIGRGLRSRPGKKRLVVVDFANFCHHWLTKHSLHRLEAYKAEDCFMISAG